MALKVGDLYASIGLDRRDFDRGLASVQATAARLRDPSLAIRVADDDAHRAIDSVDANLAAIRDADAAVRVDDADALSGIASIESALSGVPDGEAALHVDNATATTSINEVRTALNNIDPETVGLGVDNTKAIHGIGEVRQALTRIPDTTARVNVDTSGAESALAGLATQTASAHGAAGMLVMRFGAMRLMLSSVGTIAGGAFAVGLGKGVMSASDLNEQISAATALFGPASRGATEFADRSAEAFGTVRTETIGATNDIGILLKGVGLLPEHAVSLGTSFVRAAKDMESFRNVPLPEVLEAIRSGLVGETEPLRKFGINLNEATIEAEAVRLGLANMGDELTDSMKVAARSSLILKGLNIASGDLGLTQQSTANRVRELLGRLQNLANETFSRTLPAIEALLGGAVRLAEKFGWVVDKGADLVGWLGKVNAKIAPLLEKVGPLGTLLGGLGDGADKATPKLSNADQAIALLGKTTGLTKDQVMGMANELKLDLAGDVRANVAAITNAYDEAAIAAGFANAKVASAAGVSKEQLKALEAEATAIGKAVAGAMESSASIVGHFADAIHVGRRDIRKFFADQIKDTREWANLLAAAVSSGVDQGLVRQIAEAGPKAAPLLRGLLDEVRVNGVGAINQSQTDLRKIMTQTTDMITSYTGPAGRAGQGVGTASGLGMAGGLLSTQWEVDRSTGVVVGRVVERMHGADVEAARAGAALPVTMAGAILGGIGSPIGAVAELARRVQAQTGSAASNAHETGRSVSDGLASGINANAPRAIEAARRVAAETIRIMGATIKPGSPSKVTTYLGAMLAAGLVKGMDAGASAVAAASANLAAAAIPGVIPGDMGSGRVAPAVAGTIETHNHYHLSVTANEVSVDENKAGQLFRRMEIMHG